MATKSPDEYKVKKVEVFYDRHQKMWCTQPRNYKGYAIGQRDYWITKAEAQKQAKRMKK
jgi:hypothetical protein